MVVKQRIECRQHIRWLIISMVLLLGLILAACGGGEAGRPNEGPIKVTARNIRFTPDTLTVKAGR